MRNMKQGKFLQMALVLAMGFVAMSSCGSNEDEEAGSNERRDVLLTRSEQELANLNNDFAFKLFQAMPQDKSIIVSPLSITYALGMLNNGAGGETRQQISQVLGFGTNGVDAVNEFCKKLLSEAARLDRKTKVVIANNVYVNKGRKLQPTFVEMARAYYGVVPEECDFTDSRTLRLINRWASDHTNGMIPQILDELNPNSVSYLLNAIYFKGSWTERFWESNTKNETFGGKTIVPMMNQSHRFAYTETEDFQLLRMPYGNEAYSMTFLLPRVGKGIAEVLQTLTAEEWKKLTSSMDSWFVDVKIPRFETLTDVNLEEVMSGLGMPRAFTPQAEFPDFCATPTYIEKMKQVAKITLNEKGTEVAAVTMAGMAGDYVPDDRVEFHANRPFLYVISEQSTGTIFFIGSYRGR